LAQAFLFQYYKYFSSFIYFFPY